MTDDRTLAAALGAKRVVDVHHVEISPALFDRLTAAPAFWSPAPGLRIMLDDRLPPGAWVIVGTDGSIASHGLDLSTARMLDAMRRARALVSAFWSQDHPPTLRHEAEQLEQRLISFTDTLANIAAAPPAADPASEGSMPTLDEAVAYRYDQWVALLRAHRIGPGAALAVVRSDAEAEGLTPPPGLREIVGDPAYSRLLLRFIDKCTHQVAASRG